MKTKVVIEIETKGQYNLLPEEGTTEEEYTEEELEKFRKEYEENIHKQVKAMLTKYLEEDGQFQDDFMDWDEGDFVYVEGWDEFEKYNTTVKVVEEKNE